MGVQKFQKANGKISIFDMREKPAKTKTISINIPDNMKVEDIKRDIEKCLFKN
ncbi:hypothetical protein J4226_00265 [Candidatus Pacearchaeota archaeon]|nr:hypothetical protein [Candidatus Pacearchaeota archaeon]